MPESHAITLLHLSDPQFGPRHRFTGAGLDSLLGRLRDDLQDMRDRHGLAPDLALITGDLVEHGKPSQFREFRAFAEALAAELGLPRRKIVLIPGNHDISRLRAEAYFKTCEADEVPPVRPYWPKLADYAAMVAEFYAGEPDLHFTEAAPYTYFEYPDLRLVVAGLNSTIADSHRPEDHYGLLGEDQLRFFAGKLRTAAELGWLRIAALHHNPYPTGNSKADLQDLADFKRIVRPHLNLVLHGHVHEHELEWLDQHIPVLGIGSAGVDLQQRPPEVPNQYQWIRLRERRLEFGSRAFVPDQKRWIDDLRPDLEGAHGWQHRDISFQKVHSTFGPASPAPSPEHTLARSIAAYRSALARQLRHRPSLHDLATLGEDADLRHGLDLLTLFVTPQAAQEIPRDDRNGLPNANPLLPQEAPDPALVRTTPQAIDALLASREYPWILLLGAPGAGKTTVSTWTALKLCAEGEALGELPTDLVPVTIDLRLFAAAHRAAHERGATLDFFDHLDARHRERSLELRGDALRGLAAEGRLVWLFDGLDEIAEDPQRREIAEMILGLRARYGGRGLVTGRLVGCRELQPFFREGGIHTFTLLDFDDAQIESYLQRWHDLVFASDPEVGARRRERLRKTLAEVPAVRDLCKNPLLLTLVALLSRGDELPRRRHNLLGRAAELMLGQWDANKGISNTTRFDLGLKRRFLSQLAWHMLTELPGGAGNLIDEAALERFTATFCAQEFALDPADAATTARALIAHLRERNYVLGLLGGRAFGFLHKAFFESFAADEAHRRFRSQTWRLADLERLFVARWELEGWREVLFLICGHLQEDRPEHVVALLCALVARQHPFVLASRDDHLAFCVRALGEVQNLAAGPAHDFAQALNELLLARAPLYDPWSGGFTALLRAFQFSAGHWPGAQEALARIAALPSFGLLYPATTYAFCSALPPEQRMATLIAWIRDGTLSPTLGDLALFDGRRPLDPEALELALTDPCPIAERLALAVALHEGPYSVRGESVFRFLEGRLLQEDMNHITSGPGTLHRRLCTLLLRERPQLLANPWFQGHLPAEPPHEDAFAVASMRRAFETFPRTCPRYQLLEIAISLRSTDLLALALEPHKVIPLYVPQKIAEISDADEKRRFEDWCRTKGVTDEDLHFGECWVKFRSAGEDGKTIAHQLLRPQSGAQRPKLGILEPIAARLYFQSLALPLDFIKELQEAYPAHHEEIGLTLLVSWLRQPSHPGIQAKANAEANANLQANANALLAACKDTHPLLWLFFSMQLSRPLPPTWREALQHPNLLERLRPELHGELDLQRLRSVAQQARALDPEHLPWRLLLREVFDRSRELRDRWEPCDLDWERRLILPLRLGVALELGAPDLIAELQAAYPDEPGPPAALGLLAARDRLLRIGRLRRALVQIDGTRVGTLSELPGGTTRFAYDPDNLARAEPLALAPTLPVRAEPYDSPGLHPIFEGLLPQGWLLDLDLRKYALRPSDQFGLLLATGRDTIGAIEIIEDPT